MANHVGLRFLRAGVACALVLCATKLAAQQPLRVERFPEPQAQQAERSPSAAFLASLLAPGMGQAYLHRGRWAPYVALEAWTWISYLNHKSRGKSLERDYRDFAWNVARRISVGPRHDSDFVYYEAMYDWLESGAFDMDPVADGVQPDQDTVTFNGDTWSRAKALFMPGGNAQPGSPQYEEALHYYKTKAITPEFAWSWSANRLEFEQFKRKINDSDRSLRLASRTLGFILAVHMVSAIDALVTARLQEAGHHVQVDSRLEREQSSMIWTSTVRIMTK